jgi:UDP-galactopyranose mutase
MGKRGPKPKEVEEFSIEVWDNYNPYYSLNEPSQKDLDRRFNEKALKRMEKNLTLIANSAGYIATSSSITHLAKKALIV